MRIFEVSSSQDPDPDRLMGLVQFLSGRADDQAARKQISQEAFIKLARQLGIIITPNNLAELVDKPPLSNLLEPLDPNSGVITFKGGEQSPTAMPVNQAQDIVAGMAKRANPLG
jgi:hypothetical protein